jgi:hypothetical protein
MIKKQDRQGVRRPADVERKYNFKKQFTETRTVAEEARKIASDISETDKGLSLKVKALDDDINGENGVKAQLDLKVETDKDGNLKSRVHVSGNEFTVDTDNFQLDENGNVAISGAFHTESEDGQYSTDIDGGVIHVDAPVSDYGVDDNGNAIVAHQIIRFTSLDNHTYALVAVGVMIPRANDPSKHDFNFQRMAVEILD